jgi:hypothetical protein
MKNAVFWDDTPCGSCKNRHFIGTFASIISLTRIGELGMLAVTSNRSTLHSIVPSSPVFVALMIEAIHSTKMPILTRATWCTIPEDGIL